MYVCSDAGLDVGCPLKLQMANDDDENDVENTGVDGGEDDDDTADHVDTIDLLLAFRHRFCIVFFLVRYFG